jgi:hypothetical protein
VVFFKEHHWYRCSALKGKKERKMKGRGRTEVRTEGKVPDRPHRRSVQSGRQEGDEEQRGNKRKGWKSTPPDV